MVHMYCKSYLQSPANLSFESLRFPRTTVRKRHIYFVCIEETNYLWLVLTNGFTVAVVAIGKLAKGNYAALGVISKFHHDQA